MTIKLKDGTSFNILNISQSFFSYAKGIQLNISFNSSDFNTIYNYFTENPTSVSEIIVEKDGEVLTTFTGFDYIQTINQTYGDQSDYSGRVQLVLSTIENIQENVI